VTGSTLRQTLFALFIALGALQCKAQDVQTENIPDQILPLVGQGHFAALYNLDGSLNPFYLRGDFDVDGKTDYAVRIKSRAGKGSGIAIWLSSKRQFLVLGAGVPFKVSGSVISNLDFSGHLAGLWEASSCPRG
jgi:hypothetical protein